MGRDNAMAEHVCEIGKVLLADYDQPKFTAQDIVDFSNGELSLRVARSAIRVAVERGWLVRVGRFVALPDTDLTPDPLLAVEERIYAAQQRWIERHCGEEAAGLANYGWGVSVTDDYVWVATKVYRHGILTSEASPGVRVSHEWRPFSRHPNRAQRSLKEKP